MILWKLLVLLNVLKNFFSTYLGWVFSWFLNLESWILILIIRESWFLKLDSWILNLDSWNLILEYLDFAWFLILWHHQNNLGRHWFHRLPKRIQTFFCSLWSRGSLRKTIHFTKKLYNDIQWVSLKLSFNLAIT